MDFLGPFRQIIEFCWYVLNLEFTVNDFTFSLWDVFVVTILISIGGLVIGVVLGGRFGDTDE